MSASLKYTMYVKAWPKSRRRFRFFSKHWMFELNSFLSGKSFLSQLPGQWNVWKRQDASKIKELLFILFSVRPWIYKYNLNLKVISISQLSRLQRKLNATQSERSSVKSLWTDILKLRIDIVMTSHHEWLRFRANNWLPSYINEARSPLWCFKLNGDDSIDFGILYIWNKPSNSIQLR